MTTKEDVLNRALEKFEADVFSILCDFFERQVVQRGQLDPDDGLLHTSQFSRLLAVELEDRFSFDALYLGPDTVALEEAGYTLTFAERCAEELAKS